MPTVPNCYQHMKENLQLNKLRDSLEENFLWNSIAEIKENSIYMHNIAILAY